MWELKSPGRFINVIDRWDQLMQKMGDEATALWPNYPVAMPKDVRKLFCSFSNECRMRTTVGEDVTTCSFAYDEQFLFADPQSTGVFVGTTDGYFLF